MTRYLLLAKAKPTAPRAPLYPALRAPDGLPHRVPRWCGGTWGGTCGATLWVPNPVRVTEARIDGLHGVELHERPTEYSGPLAKRYGGARVVCGQPYKHAGQHRAWAYRWADDPAFEGWMTRERD